MDLCYAYINDVLVASISEDEHEQHLRTLFQRFSEYGVMLNPTKCVFGAKEVTFLGYTVSAEGTRPLEGKVAAINRFKQPALVKELRRLLGMLSFYRRFVSQAASIQPPFHAALAVPKVKGSQPVDWTPTMVQAFEDCKASISCAILLAHPDPSATLAIFTDASDTSIGAALQQRVCDARQPLAFYSRKLSPSQKKYSPTASFWQYTKPSNTSDIWLKAVPLSLPITSLSRMLSRNDEVNANHANSVTCSLLGNC